MESPLWIVSYLVHGLENIAVVRIASTPSIVRAQPFIIYLVSLLLVLDQFRLIKQIISDYSAILLLLLHCVADSSLVNS